MSVHHSCCVAEWLESRRLFSSKVGLLDSSFGDDGLVQQAFQGGYDNAHGVAVQSDGKVIVVGDAEIQVNGSEKTVLAAVRYNADGTLDDGGSEDSTPGDQFGTGGKFTYFAGGATLGTSIAIQKDGKIILAGTENTGGSNNQQAWLVLRLNVDGTLDTSFNGAGYALTPFSSYNTPLTSIHLDSSGRILAAGSLNGDWLVGRFTTTGQLDSTFGTGGDTTTDFGGTDSAASVTTDNLGNIIVFGGVGGNGVNQGVAVARYLSDGSLDPDFATGGKYIEASTSVTRPVGVAYLPDGTIEATWSHYVNNAWEASHVELTHAGVESSGGGGSPERSGAIAVLPIGLPVTVNEVLSFQNSATTYPNVSIGRSYLNSLDYFDNQLVINSVAGEADGSIYAAGFYNTSAGRSFGLIKLVGVDPSTYGTVSGNVFRDSDGDTVHDSNESGVPNVRVFADLNGDGVWDQALTSPYAIEPSVLTDAKGNYTLTDLPPGAVLVREVSSAVYAIEGSAASGIAVKVVGGRTTSSENFADKPKSLTSTQTAITGSVFSDDNGDGQRQVDTVVEANVSNVVVYLDTNKDGLLDKHEVQTITDASGNFTLNLPAAGKYRVALVVPVGEKNTTPAFYDLTVHTSQQANESFGITYKDPDGTLATAGALPIGKAAAGTIGNPVDVDVLKFTVKAGQTLSFDEDAAKGSPLDSLLRLFDAHGHTLATNDNGAAPGEGASVDSFLKFKFTTAGTYYIAVSDSLNSAFSARTGLGDLGGGTIGKYTLTTTLQ